MTQQHDCPCNVRSPYVCAYANLKRICYGRPDMIPKTVEEAQALYDYFTERRKR